MHYKIQYLLKEHKTLYPGRFLFTEVFFSKAPEFHFDGSDSKLILGNQVAVRGNISFLFNNNGIIDIGPGTFFNNSCSINCFQGIKIGPDCLFGENVKLYDHNHEYRVPDKLIKDQGYTNAAISIGSNCWFGSNVIVLKGVSIGNSCIIGANCVIFKDIPDNYIVTSNAADQVMKQRR